MQRQTKHEEKTGARRRRPKSRTAVDFGFFEWDVRSDRLRCSEALFALAGVDRAPTTPNLQAYLDLTHPEDSSLVQQTILEALRLRRPFRVDHRIVRPDGQVRMIQCRGEVVVSDAGEPLRLTGFAWDVTDHAEAERELERLRGLLTATLDTADDGILVIDRTGSVTTYNDHFLTLWNIPPRMAEQGSDAALLAFAAEQLDDPAVFTNNIRELYDHPTAHSRDILRFRDGRIIERNSAPHRFGDQIVGRVWSFRDVTEREGVIGRLEFLSNASRLLTSLDVDRALDGLAQLTVSYLGASCTIELNRRGAPRKTVSVAREPGPLSRQHRSDESVRASPTIYEIEGVSHMALPLTIRGNPVGTMIVAAPRDRAYTRSDLELAEELATRLGLALESSELYEAAREALHARDELLAIAAHEIRGPLMSIELGVQSLHARALGAEAIPRVLEIVEREVKRLARFVEELLDVSRLHPGRLELELELIDLEELVREVVHQQTSAITEGGSKVTTSAESEVRGLWDRHRLQQVVTNLVTNAFKFGLGRPIDIVMRADEERATLIVRDRGIGIEPAAQQAIFEPFEQRVSSRQYGGLGLGLHICRTIVESCGGRISVQSAVGAGTTFTVELPLRPAHEP